MEQQTQQQDEILLFKLTSGDEVIAKIVGEQGQSFIIDKPYAFTYTTASDGSVNGGIMRWLGQSKDGIVMLNAHQVVATTTPKDEIIKAYRVSTGEIPNIQVPDKKILVG